MDRMLKNFEAGKYPIDQDCIHPQPCPKCAALNGHTIIQTPDHELHELTAEQYARYKTVNQIKEG
jgi:hypothetical protein